MKPPPIKRSENIVLLSRDHHHGLLFAWKLRQGIQYGATPERMAPYVAYFWEAHLAPHFREEEEILFAPAIENELVQQALQEHVEILRLVTAGVEATAHQPLSVLADAVTAHIRFEERTLFPYLENNLSPETLREIGAALDAVHIAGDDTWEDAFWKKPV